MSDLNGFAYLAQNPLISIGSLILVIMTIVFFHELGHFLVGRWCGVKVDVFSIGFGPELFSWVDGKGTRWRFAALPLGGYVKFYGDKNAASAPDADLLSLQGREDYARSFAGKSVWQRALIVIAGPAANFILALAIYTGLFYVQGRNVIVPKFAAIVQGSAAERAGFQAGDIVLSIDGRTVSSFGDLQRIVSTNADIPLNFEIDRAGMHTQIIATPEQKVVSTYFGKQSVGVLGIQASQQPEDIKLEHYNLLGSARLASQVTWQTVEMTGTYFSRLLSGHESSDKISGMARTAEVAGKMAELGFGALLDLVALVSISIGLMNLLPVPILDGGHLVFFVFEALRGRPLSPRMQEIGFSIGLLAIAALVLFSNFNDIVHMRAG